MMRYTGFILLVAALVLSGCESDPAGIPVRAVHRVDVGPTNRTIVVGDTMRLHAYPKTEDGTVLGSVLVSWTSDIADIVALSPTGLVRGLRPGTVEVTATAEGKAGTTTVTVIAATVPVDRIELSPPVVGMTVGQQVMLEARLYAADGSILGGRPVTWSTSQPTRVTVDFLGDPWLGLLSAHAPGEVTIRAAAEGRSASYTFMVVAQPGPVVGSVIVTPPELTAWVGSYRTFTAHVQGPNGGPLQNPPPVTWTVSNGAVGALEPNGQVRALRKGMTVVTATSGGKSGSARLYVYPQPSDSMTFTLLPNIDASGNITVSAPIGEKIWYDANGVGHTARMLVAGGAIKLVHSGGSGRYTLGWRVDLAITIGNHGQIVATEFIEEAGTYTVVYDINTGMPVYKLAFPDLATTEDMRWIAPARAVAPIKAGAGPRQEWVWTQVF